MRKTFLILFFLAFSSHFFAQKQNNNWYFGDHAGITFTTTPPSFLNGNPAITQEGVASISDVNGNLLFFTDGITVWDKNLGRMPNGFLFALF